MRSKHFFSVILMLLMLTLFLPVTAEDYSPVPRDNFNRFVGGWDLWLDGKDTYLLIYAPAPPFPLYDYNGCIHEIKGRIHYGTHDDRGEHASPCINPYISHPSSHRIHIVAYYKLGSSKTFTMDGFLFTKNGSQHMAGTGNHPVWGDFAWYATKRNP